MTKKQIKKVLAILFFLLIISIVLPFFLQPVVVIKAIYNKPITVQLYYDKGDGFNEIDTLIEEIKHPEQIIRFKLPLQDIHTLRIDFGEAPDKVSIKNISIRGAGSKANLQGDAIHDIFNIKNQLNRSYVEENNFIIESTMKDPYMANTTGEIGINAGNMMWMLIQKSLTHLSILLTCFVVYLFVLLKKYRTELLQNKKISIGRAMSDIWSAFKSYNTKNQRRIVIASIIVGSFIVLALGLFETKDVITKIFNVYDLLFCIIITFVSIILLQKKEWHSVHQSISKKEWLTYSVIIFVLLLVFFMGFYPGGMTGDSRQQWNQAINQSFDDWHPVAHTFVFMYLPSLLWKNPASSTLFQMIFISTILGYIIYSLRSWGCSKKISAIYLILFAIHPSNQRMSVALWKDVPFSYSLLLFSVMIMWIYMTDGEWIKNKKHMIVFCLTGLGVLLFRHNGIIAFVPSLICLIMVYKNYRKIFSGIAISLVVIKLILTGPIYTALGIDSHPLPFTEIMGVPNNQISYIISNDGEVSDEQLAFINEIAPIEQWKNYYHRETVNPLKWARDENGVNYFNGQFIQENQQEYIAIWSQLVLNNFGLVLQSYYYVTQPIWDFTVRYDGTDHCIADEQIKPANMVPIKNTVHNKIDQYLHWCQDSWFKILTPGVGLAFFLMSVASFIARTKDKKKVLPYVPFLFNTLGIMCLITGGEIRFIYSSILVWLPMVVFSQLQKPVVKNKEI